MSRKMILRKDGNQHPLTQVVASNEEELQELVKENPDILPFEEYSLTGPLMVVGRETTLPSGSVDLVGLARSGDILIIEFKTGPQNTDFRAAIAQMLDYGSDIWGLSYDEFESTVAVRYFASNRCKDKNICGKTSLVEAQLNVWPDMGAEESIAFKDRLTKQLELGAFHYLLVAGRFTKPVERTIEYMNHLAPSAFFYAVELVSFAGDGLSAFETRTLVKPTSRGPRKASVNASEGQFLDMIVDEGYHHALQELFDVCRALGLSFEWGAVGASIRLQTNEATEPISIAWVFPPGKTGWLGLTDLTLGYDTASATRIPSMLSLLQEYAKSVGDLQGHQNAKPQSLNAYRLPPESVISNVRLVSDLLAELVKKSGEIPGKT